MNIKLLITGGTGYLASNIACYLKKKENILLTSHNKPAVFSEIQHIKIKNNNFKILEKEIAKFQPMAIIHTAGLTNVEECEKKRKMAYTANYEFSKQISKISKKYKIKLIYISTDHLYDGKKSLYDENDKLNPLNYYAKTKYLSEKIILKNDINSIILRTNFFGFGTRYKDSFTDSIIYNLKKGNKIELFNDVFFTPIHVKNLLNIILELIKKNRKGIYNISTNQFISKYDFGILLAKVFNFDNKLIIPISIESKKIVTRPRNMSLSNKKIKKIIKKDYFDLINNLKILKEEYYKNHFNLTKKFIPYGQHYISNNNIKDVTKVLKYKNLTQGDEVLKFEYSICDYVGCNYAVAVSSGSAALHIASIAGNIRKNDSVISTPNTFVSSVNSFIHRGAKPIFIDIDKSSLNMSVSSFKNISKNKKIKAIMPVHFAGASCEMNNIYKIAEDKKIKVIEDASHGLGGKYQDGSKIGNCRFSDMTIFSFHPVKSITSAEGGIITTNNKEIYKQLLRLRSHGINKLDDEYEHLHNAYTNKIFNPWYYEMIEDGFNYRLSDIHSSLARSQIKLLDNFIDYRRMLAFNYDRLFKDCVNIQPTQSKFRNLSSHHLYVIRIKYKKIKKNRNYIMNELKERGIGSQVHYIPVPLHPFYKKHGYKMTKLSNCKTYYEEALSIPLYYNLDKNSQLHVVENLKRLIE